MTQFYELIAAIVCRMTGAGATARLRLRPLAVIVGGNMAYNVSSAYAVRDTTPNVINKLKL